MITNVFQVLKTIKISLKGDYSKKYQSRETTKRDKPLKCQSHKVVCFCLPLKCGPRPGCRSNSIWVYTVCFSAYMQQTILSRQHFQMQLFCWRDLTLYVQVNNFSVTSGNSLVEPVQSSSQGLILLIVDFR